MYYHLCLFTVQLLLNLLSSGDSLLFSILIVKLRKLFENLQNYAYTVNSENVARKPRFLRYKYCVVIIRWGSLKGASNMRTFT